MGLARLFVFLQVDYMADACLYLMLNYNEREFINVVSEHEWSINELAELIKKIVGDQGPIVWDRSKPDGTPRKLIDVSKFKERGWHPRIRLPKELK